MDTGDTVRVEGRWYGMIVDMGSRRVRVRRFDSHDEEDVDAVDVEVVDHDEPLVASIMVC